jgi:hypothetical protein
LLRSLALPRNDKLKSPREHHAKDGNDHAEMQKQVRACDHVDPKDEWQKVVNDHQYNAQQWQQAFAVREVI